MTDIEDLPATVDAFHRGRFHLVQPRRRGHRAGVDAMILAAAVPDGFEGRLADLGAGAGAAGLAVAARCEKARIVLFERDPVMLDHAHRTRAHAANAWLAERVDIRAADVALRGRERTAAGLEENGFDFAVMNPPFNAADDRVTPDTLRASAHVMRHGLFEDWLRTAAALVRPRGGLALIARPVSLTEIVDALKGRFGGAEIVPVHPREGEAAIRVVVRAWRGSRAGLRLMPPLVLHTGAGNAFTARADAISNGQATLLGD